MLLAELGMVEQASKPGASGGKASGRVGIESLKFNLVEATCKSAFRTEDEYSREYRVRAHLSFNQRNVKITSFTCEVSKEDSIGRNYLSDKNK